ncbi:MAG: glycosyltransferase family 2 protein [Opitutaceae bacterium]
MKLTIAIPTYDRNEVLRGSVAKLLPQLTPACEVHILDNCSPVPVAETLQGLLEAWPGTNVRITRNPANIGGAANILRCFESCRGVWIWCLGDDDTVASDAIESILRDIARLPHATMIHYSTPVDPHDTDLTVQGQAGFINSPVSFNGMMFTPAAVYKLDKVTQMLRFGYLYAYSWGPHVAVALSALGQSGTCEVRSYDLIISNIGVGKENMWSPIGYLAGRQALLELPMSDQCRIALGLKMSRSPSVEYIACEMMLRAKEEHANREALFMYDQIAARSRALSCGFFARLKWRAYRPLVAWPNLGYFLVGVVYRVFSALPYFARNPLANLAARDRFYRA